MKRIATMFTILLASSATAQSAGDPPKLQKALEGRVAGAPQDCITLRRMKGQQSFESNSILFRMQGSKIYYRNDASGTCQKIGNGRSVILEDPAGRLCKGDVVRLVDLRTSHDFGVCRMGAFTPYTKAK
jgi:hypothetical protein